MKLFYKKTELEKEWNFLLRQESKLKKKKQNKRENFIHGSLKTLENKVPEKLQKTLESAFLKAFTIIFQKGTGIIEKTYPKREIEAIYKVNEEAVLEQQSKRNLRTFAKKAEKATNKNIVYSGISGISFGIAGAGLPDIPILTGIILKNIYEIALSYGYEYQSEEEQYFILLLIQGAVSSIEQFEKVDKKIEDYITQGLFLEKDMLQLQLQETSEALAKEVLFMKFVQGIPLVGVVGGVNDIVCMKKITQYTNLKYRKRFLSKIRQNI